MTPAPLARTARAAAHVPPTQAAHWVRLRAQRRLTRACPRVTERLLAAVAPSPDGLAGWPAGFRPLDSRLASTWPAAAVLRAGKITLLGHTRCLDGPAGWRQPGMPRLWRFHLHYWDWAWGLAADTDTAGARELFARLWTSWSAAVDLSDGDAWHPYPAALRAWSWCGLYGPLAAGGALGPRVVDALGRHAAFLRRHAESDVSGNHLIKSLKGLVGLAVFTGDHQRAHRALDRLAGQVRTQVLRDGGHCERSPAYHCQVLADLIDVAGLVEAAGILPPVELTSAIARMRRWLGTVLGPDGEVPPLNDGFPVAAGLVALLRPAAPGDQPLVVLPSSGLARLAAGGWRVLADAGGAGRWGLAGHAHAGSLGCLVWVDGAPLLVDTGTSTYEPGRVRDYERSTAAHNTATVDGSDSTEVWGGFRVGRRARAHWLAGHGCEAGAVCAAWHDGYRHLPGRPIHRRRWSLTTGGLTVDDLITGRGPHTVVIGWQLAPGVAVHLDGAAGATATAATATGLFTARVSGTAAVRLTTATRPVAGGFGLTMDAPALSCRAEGTLPLRIRAVWTRTVWTRSGLSGEGAVA